MAKNCTSERKTKPARKQTEISKAGFLKVKNAAPRVK